MLNDPFARTLENGKYYSDGSRCGVSAFPHYMEDIRIRINEKLWNPGLILNPLNLVDVWTKPSFLWKEPILVIQSPSGQLKM